MPFTCEENCFVKINWTISKDHKSPDLNPVDYAAFGALQQSMYLTPDDLKDRLCTCWENLDQPIIDQSIDHWRDKLKAVVCLNGGLLFWLSGSFAALLCYVACVLRAFVRFAIVYLALRWYCDKKVNLANNCMTFQDKIDVILCENNYCISVNFF